MPAWMPTPDPQDPSPPAGEAGASLDPTSWWQAVLDWLEANPTAAYVLGPALVIALFAVALFVGRRILLSIARRVTARTKTDWDDLLLDAKGLHWLGYLLPLVVVWSLARTVPGIPEFARGAIENTSLAAMIIVVGLSVSALLDGVHAIYRHKQGEQRRSIKGFIQLAKIFLFLTVAVLAIARLLGSSVGGLFTGIGISTAVILLIFKDTILSLIASIQLAANDMVRVGDWIEMPQEGTDGDVIDIALHTVKVQNWDKTISTIPTARLYTESFKNWRGMSLSGGRRIKRNLLIDVETVRFLTADDLARLNELELLADYLAGKRDELKAANASRKTEPAVNLRQLTNLGTFRAYVVAYLRSLPAIRRDMTLIVRQLQPSAEGLPLEIYAFTATTAWADYENIQADIVDHLIASLVTFDLRLAQHPTGQDVRRALTDATKTSRTG